MLQQNNFLSHILASFVCAEKQTKQWMPLLTKREQSLKWIEFCSNFSYI